MRGHFVTLCLCERSLCHAVSLREVTLSRCVFVRGHFVTLCLCERSLCQAVLVKCVIVAYLLIDFPHKDVQWIRPCGGECL